MYQRILNENHIAAATHILVKYMDEFSPYYGSGFHLGTNRNISWGVKAAGG